MYTTGNTIYAVYKTVEQLKTCIALFSFLPNKPQKIYKKIFLKYGKKTKSSKQLANIIDDKFFCM